MLFGKLLNVVAACGVAAAMLSITACSKEDSSTAQVQLIGAGATFPAPIYQQWFKDYHEKNSNVVIEYKGIGSGGGIQQFTDGNVDFGASDAAMTDTEMAAVKGGVVLLPMTAGSIVLCFNVPSVKELKLPRKAYADIFLGKVTKWNDPEIAAGNPGVSLPDSAISVVHRAEGSGTTFVFTNHLSAISPEWKSGPGTAKDAKFPVGVGAKGNDGVTALIKQTPGSIGYIEYGYAMNSGLPMAELENKSGKFVAATPASAAASLAAVQMPADLRAWLPDPEGADSYPIVSYTWLLCHTSYADANKGKTLKAVIEYGLTEGQKISTSLGYIPLPDSVVQKVKAAADGIKVGG